MFHVEHSLLDTPFTTMFHVEQFKSINPFVHT